MFVTDLYKRHSVLGRTVTEMKKRHNFLGFFGLIWTQGKIVTLMPLINLSVEASTSNSDLHLMPLINLHCSCFNRPRSWYSNMQAYAANDWIYIRDHQDNSTYRLWPWRHTDLCNKNHVEIAMEIDPLEALMENSATWTRLSKTEFWNGPDQKSPCLIVVLISYIIVAIDTLQCNQGIPHCNIFYTVATITKNNATTKFRGNTYTILHL
jgi:hypothetical protein